MYKDQVILITGGTGSWGNELTKQLIAQEPKEIRIFSRGEKAQVVMKRKFSDERLTFIIGDIRDKDAIKEATVGVDYIFHLAALKHVPVCEEQPKEALKTNQLGTQNLIEAAIVNKVKKVIDVSTDKAVEPLNLYGMSKAVGERLIIQANNLTSETDFVCIRAGNVLGSNGSVVPLFISQIKENNEVKVTNMQMTRYFITLEEAIGLLFKAAEESCRGEIFVVRMPACRIVQLAEVLVGAYGDGKTQISESAIRPGEKLHEVLIGEYEVCNTYCYDKNYYVIKPMIKIIGNGRVSYKDFKKVDFNKFASNNQLMNLEEIEQMLRRGEFID